MPLSTVDFISRVVSSLKKFKDAKVSDISTQKIVEAHFQWSFGRSRGPGGQNVNKRNTFVRLKIDPERAIDWIPLEVVSSLNDRHKNPFIVCSDTHREQQMNKADCLERMRIRLLESAIATGPAKGPTASQSHRVKQLKEIYSRQKEICKKFHSFKKSLRQRPNKLNRVDDDL